MRYASCKVEIYILNLPSLVLLQLGLCASILDSPVTFHTPKPIEETGRKIHCKQIVAAKGSKLLHLHRSRRRLNTEL